MDMTNLDLARRALYLARFASAPTFVGKAASVLMRRIGAEIEARGVSAVELLALFRAARVAPPKCTVCGECQPVAAYGGWCCAEALALCNEAYAEH